jgi:hypothetical protein
MTDEFRLGGESFSSRLLVGTAGYPNQQAMLDSIERSGAEIVTLSIRRISLAGYSESLVDVLGGRYRLLPNTAGCATAKDAVLTAQLAREALETSWVKLEIIGATVEERGFDATVTAGAVYALLEGARRALPAIEDLALDEIWTGFRPSSRDDAPILGPTAVSGLVVASGHHRNGILLTPVTAEAITELVLSGAVPDAIRPFGIERFRDRRSAPREMEPA